MTLGDYLRVLRRRWLLVAATVLLALGIAAALTLLAKPTYEASASLFVTTPAATNVGESYEGNLFSQQRVASYAELVTSEDVLTQTIGMLKLDTTPTELANQISVQAVPETVVINIAVSDASASQAADIANTLADVFVAKASNLESPDPTVPPLSRVIVAQRATVPQARTAPNHKMNLALGGLVGLIAGCGLALLSDRYRRTVGDRTDIENLTGATVLAPACRVGSARSSGLVDFDAPANGAAEAYRCLAAVFADHTVLASRVTMFTSPENAREKTAAVINLAAALAESGSSVCLVDGDLRNRALTHDLDADGDRGLTNVLSGEANVRDVLVANGTINVLSAGPAASKPTRLFGARFAGVMNELAARFDHVIIDAPPLPEFADAALISRSANETVIVVRSEKTSRKKLTAAIDLLAEANAHLFGIVIVAAGRGPSGSRRKRPADNRRESSSPTQVRSNAAPSNGRLSVAELEDREWGQAARVPTPSSNNHH